MPRTLMLITITGRDKPGITSTLTAVLAEHQVHIEDIEQVTNGGNLTLSIMIRLESQDVRAHPVFKDLIFAAWELGVHADFHPIDAHEQDVNVSNRAFALTIFGREITAAGLAAVTRVLAEQRINIENIQKLSRDRFSCIELSLSASKDADINLAKQLLLPQGKQHGLNLALQRESIYRRAKRLIVLDVDSTLICGEVIDALAVCAGVGAQVKRITESAMRGELDYGSSLRQRVALLKGLEASTLAKVREETRLTPGSRDLIRVLKRLGYKVAIISGGFSYFTNWLKAELNIDYAYANELEVCEGRLTGGLRGPIVDALRKADLLETIAQGEGIVLDQVIAVGDGANDLHMLKRAGLGIAFNANRTLREAADQTIDDENLDAILYLLGIRGHELDELLN